MDVSNEYVKAVTESKLLQELWEPRMLQMVCDREKSNLSWIGQRIYDEHNGDLSGIKNKVLWVPQGGDILLTICVYMNSEYESWPSDERVEFNNNVMNDMYSVLREERTRYANWDLLFKSREKRELYYFLKFIENKEFPRISLLSTN